MKTIEELKARFWAKVDKRGSDECWLWTGHAHTFGYGGIRMNGRFDRAHRASWVVNRGPIPAGMHVLHSCDVRNCVNPAHLFLGTNADNMADKMSKGRGRWAHGEKNGAARVSDASVAAMRLAHAAGERVVDLAARFGLSRSQATRILTGKARSK